MFRPPSSERQYHGIYQPPVDEEALNKAGLSDEVMEWLRNPANSLPLMAVIQDQATGVMRRYDPQAICPELQLAMLEAVGNAPRTRDGMKMWHLWLASRQTGKSVTAALATDNHAAYAPGSTVATIADVRERAETLFRHTLVNREHIEKAHPRYSPPTVPNRETRKRTYMHGSVYLTLSSQQNNVGIGRSLDFLHLSEAPFHQDFAGFWSLVQPAIINRAEAMVFNESTPAPMTQPSAEAVKDLAAQAMSGDGRWIFHFVPFWGSRLNQRIWPEGQRPTNAELRLLERYGPKSPGEMLSHPDQLTHLTLENLQFRREVMETDAEIRRFPELFETYYPFDPMTCWAQAGGGVIPAHALDRHRNSLLVPWTPGETYMVYRDPIPGAYYVIGVDPAGYGSDHASFVVFEVWADAIIQVAEFSCGSITPTRFADQVADTAEAYNGALVGVERNGVGIAVTERLRTLIDEGRRFELFYDTRGVKGKPGIPASKQMNDLVLGTLIDELMDRAVLYSQALVAQMGSYRNDKVTADSDKFQLLNPGKLGQGRRAKHHWDRVSAAGYGFYLARFAPSRRRPAYVGKDPGVNDPAKESGKEQSAWSHKDMQEYRRVLDRDARLREAAHRRGQARLSRRAQKELNDSLSDLLRRKA